jgi:hypothetical protein
MDINHINAYPGAENCKMKHTRYVWPTTTGVTEAIIITDSLLKWMRALQKSIVHAIPGADIERLRKEVQRGTINVRPFQAVVICAGTNSLEKNTPEDLCDQMAALHDLIKQQNPTCKILISGILTRPRDEDNGITFTKPGNRALSPKRTDSNTLLKEMAKSKGCTFLSTWKTL